MAMSGQILSQTGHFRLRSFETAPRPLVGYAHDYPDAHDTAFHRHPRAQLLFATEGVMRVATDRALFTIPPGTGLWVPADEMHRVRMHGPVRMRALFLRADAASSGPDATVVVAVSPLLRELILTVCSEPVVWDTTGPMALVADLVLYEIRRAPTRPLSLPACRDPRIARVASALTANPADERDLAQHAAAAGASVRTLARLFRTETGMSFQQWRRQLRMTEALARLSLGETPARVSVAVGYASLPAFGAAYRETFGITPAGRTREDPN